MERKIIAALVENQAGVLTRVSSLFSRRGFNIESLTVGETEDKTVSRMTIIVDCDDRLCDQVVHQLRKLVCVRMVAVIPDNKSVTRELVLIKVRANPTTRPEILMIATVFRAHVIDIGHESMTLELTGEVDKTSAMVDLMKGFGVLEIARTGMVALSRGSNTIYDNDAKEEE